MKLMRSLLCLLALAMLLSCFAACGPKAQPDNGDTTEGVESTEGTDAGTEGANDEASLNLPAPKTYDYDFIILSDSNGSGDMPHYIDDENKPSGDVLRNALYIRQTKMAELYDVVLKFKQATDYMDALRTANAAGDYICDVTMIKAVDTFALATEGSYHNFLNLSSSMNLEASYWDQRIQEEYRINDMLFTLEGDYTYLDEMRTLVVLYNESVYDKYSYKESYGTPYSLVEKNDWTYSVMMEMIKDLSVDTNDDGSMNESDTWGMVSELTATYYFFLGAGLKTMDNNHGELSLRLTDTTEYSRIYDVIEETITMADNGDILMANDGKTITDQSRYWMIASDIFEADRALFRTTTLSAVSHLSDMKSDYGILPIPQYFEDQTGYYCWVSGNTATPMAISIHVPDAAVTAEIAERLCYHSRYGGSDTLYSAFFDQMAYSRICRTQDDINMLEVVIDSKTYDVDQVTKITGVESSMYSLAKADNYTVLSSTLSGLVESANSKLDKYLITLIANNSK